MRRANAALNEEAACVNALLDGGYLRIYMGVCPIDPNDPPPYPSEPLAELRFKSPAFRVPVGGIVDANPLVVDGDASGEGIAGWFRAYRSNGTPVYDGTVGSGSGFDLTLDHTLIRRGARVGVKSVRYVAARGV